MRIVIGEDSTLFREGLARLLADAAARVARALRAADPRPGILLLSQHVETRHSVDLVSGGGSGNRLEDRVPDVDDVPDDHRRVLAVVAYLRGATHA